MIAIHVSVHVRAEHAEAFLSATLENARNSLNEAGVLRFDVLQQSGDPARFLLVEVYRTEEDPARHKETAHYAAWRAAVEPMMASPRSSVKFVPLFPEEDGWPASPEGSPDA